jgi:hypothetical protein
MRGHAAVLSLFDNVIAAENGWVLLARP